jgi:acyl-CoA synthetase (AMP-forming)/AMP-acid ligase II
MAGVPLLWQQLAHERSPFTRTNFPSFRYITNSGGRMPEHITRLFRKCHPNVDIFLMYGLTEAFRSTYLRPDQVDARPTSIGKAIPNVEILILNQEGKPCKPGETGELVHRGGILARGYWRDEITTAERFKPVPHQENTGGSPEIAVYSGDNVTIDAEGYLYFVGRRDQLIKSHGMRVSPEEVEEILYKSGIVKHAVVFGVENQVDTNIVAAIVPNRPDSFAVAQLLSYCKREMPEYMIPGDVWQVDQIPTTSTGKPDRIRLKEMYYQKKQLS